MERDLYDLVSNHNNYFDLEDLMAECSKVTTLLNVSILNMSYFLNKIENNEKESKIEHMEIGSKHELPLWLVKDLFKRRVYIKMDIPRYLKLSYRKAYRAGVEVLNLQKHGPYFYLLAQKFCYLIIKNDNQAVEILECIEWVK